MRAKQGNENNKKRRKTALLISVSCLIIFTVLFLVFNNLIFFIISFISMWFFGFLSALYIEENLENLEYFCASKGINIMGGVEDGNKGKTAKKDDGKNEPKTK